MAYKCETCRYLAERALPTCRQSGHRLVQLKVKKRTFVCDKCKKRTTVLNQRLPTNPCERCRNWAWKPEDRMQHANVPAEETMLPRGQEHGRHI